MIDYKPKERQDLEDLYRKQNVRINQLEQENKKLKEDNRFLTKISKEYMKKENIIEITEFTELYKDKLEEENQKLKLHIEAKDKAYTALLKDYEEIKKDRKKILDEIEAEIERFKSFRNR